MERPARGIKHANRIQYDTTREGKKVFREYWIHEWDEVDYDVHEHIKDLKQAIIRAREIGYNDDLKKLEQLQNDVA